MIRLPTLLLALAAFASCATPRNPSSELAGLLDRTRAELGLPGMAAAVWRDGRLTAAASGERALGSGVMVRPDDPFHLGSVTKPFTATMAARLVERGVIGWRDRVADRLGDLPAIRPDYLDVTLADLLAHRGGLPENPARAEDARLAGAAGLVERRRLAAAIILAEPPAAAPGRHFRYSNFHYVVAAAMIERAAGEEWEALVRRELLEPLGLGSAGFGPPPGGADLSAPVGHTQSGLPLNPADPRAVDPDFARPAAGLHMSMADLVRFGADQLPVGPAGKERLLRPESYAFVHRPVAGGMAIGWEAGPEGELSHDGSNLRWFALLRILPAERLVIAVAANSAGPDEDRTRRGLLALSERLRRIR